MRPQLHATSCLLEWNKRPTADEKKPLYVRSVCFSQVDSGPAPANGAAPQARVEPTLQIGGDLRLAYKSQLRSNCNPGLWTRAPVFCRSSRSPSYRIQDSFSRTRFSNRVGPFRSRLRPNRYLPSGNPFANLADLLKFLSS